MIFRFIQITTIRRTVEMCNTREEAEAYARTRDDADSQHCHHGESTKTFVVDCNAEFPVSDILQFVKTSCGFGNDKKQTLSNDLDANPLAVEIARLRDLLKRGADTISDAADIIAEVDFCRQRR